MCWQNSHWCPWLPDWPRHCWVKEGKSANTVGKTQAVKKTGHLSSNAELNTSHFTQKTSETRHRVTDTCVHTDFSWGLTKYGKMREHETFLFHYMLKKIWHASQWQKTIFYFKFICAFTYVRWNTGLITYNLYTIILPKAQRPECDRQCALLCRIHLVTKEQQNRPGEESNQIWKDGQGHVFFIDSPYQLCQVCNREDYPFEWMNSVLSS